MSKFINRWLPVSKQSFFLFGPRGTGKSTLLQARYPAALRLDFLNPAVSDPTSILNMN